MTHRTCKLAVMVALLPAAVGCEAPPKPISLDTTGVRGEVDFTDLAAVLGKAVDKNGLLVTEALKEHSQRLDEQLRRLAVTGPNATAELFTTPDEKIAYWYNARTAWSMKLAMMSEKPDKLNRSELTGRIFPLDGKEMTLGRIDEVLKACDDWRVLVVSPGVTLSRAALPRRPFSGEDIRSRITERFSQFVDDERRFIIDVDRRRIRVPEILWGYRERIIKEHRESTGTGGANLTTALLPHVEGSAHRRLQDAIGYRSVAARWALRLALGGDNERSGP